MTRRGLQAVFGTLALLLLVWLVVRLTGEEARPDGTGPDIGAVVGTDLSLLRVTGSNPDDTVRLERRAGEWTVNGYPADSELVGETLAALDTARAGRLVARSPSNHARLGVGDGQTRTVAVGPAESPAIVFYLGASRREGRYIRLPGAAEVYVVAAESLRGLDRDVEGWRDRKIAMPDTASVRWYRIGRPEYELVVTRERKDSLTTWRVNGDPADSARAARVLETVADLKASGFPTDSLILASDFDHPGAVLELYDSEPGAAGAVPSLSLLFVRLEEGPDHLVRRADRPLMYLVGSWTVGGLLPTRDELTP